MFYDNGLYNKENVQTLFFYIKHYHLIFVETHIILLMIKIKFSEQNNILYTAILVLIAGVIRYLFPHVGGLIFYLAFTPFLVYRLYTLFRNRKRPRTQVGFYRLVVLIFMLVTLVFNAMDWQKADFFLVFLLMADYLLVINGRF